MPAEHDGLAPAVKAMGGRQRARAWVGGWIAVIGCAVAGGAAELPPPGCLRILREARIAQELGEDEKALALFSRALEEYPTEILPVEELLSRREGLGLDAERVGELQVHLARRLADPSLPLDAGSIHFLVTTAGDERPDLLEALVAAIEARGEPLASDPVVTRAVAAAQGRLGRAEEARATLERLLADDPDFGVVSRALQLDLELGRWESALSLVDAHLEDPELAPVLGPFRLELLARTGRTSELLEELDRLHSRHAELLSAHGVQQLLKRIAWGLYDAGQHDEAERIWREILARRPEDTEARQVVAHLFADEDGQLAAVDRQLAGVEDSAKLLELGTEYLAAGDDQRAYELLSRISRGARDEVAWFNLGLAALRLERWEEASAAFRESIQRNPRRPGGYRNLGTALWEAGRCAEAIPVLERAAELEPDRVSTWYYLAKCHQSDGDAARAAEAMSEYRRRHADG
jgi:tetratricopeptide (TPR) repeat protein